jgi:indole-3-glycerol phosphate synthase
LLDAALDEGLDALVEVHNEAEMERAARAGATVIGINNRDLRTFVTTLETSERLRPLVPAGAVAVAESGIDTPADIKRLREARFDAFLIGEALMRAPDPGAKLRALLRAGDH